MFGLPDDQAASTSQSEPPRRGRRQPTDSESVEDNAEGNQNKEVFDEGRLELLGELHETLEKCKHVKIEIFKKVAVYREEMQADSSKNVLFEEQLKILQDVDSKTDEIEELLEKKISSLK